MLMLKGGRVGLKNSLILPISQPDPLQTELVVSIEWIRNQMVVQQVGLYHSWNLSRMPLANFGLVRVSHSAKLPARSQRARGKWFCMERQFRKQRKEDQKNYHCTKPAAESQPMPFHVSAPSILPRQNSQETCRLCFHCVSHCPCLRLSRSVRAQRSPARNAGIRPVASLYQRNVLAT